jgi:4a-hydroxytetrahydrobiopterin dehydratase
MLIPRDRPLALQRWADSGTLNGTGASPVGRSERRAAASSWEVLVMNAPTADELTRKRCVPCEGGVPRLTADEAEAHLASVPDWSITPDGQRIRREWRVKNFMAAIRFFNRVADVAEEEGHHPDLHLVGYRNVAVEIWTHAIGGLSENDFILAAKIDRLSIELKA